MSKSYVYPVCLLHLWGFHKDIQYMRGEEKDRCGWQSTQVTSVWPGERDACVCAGVVGTELLCNSTQLVPCSLTRRCTLARRRVLPLFCLHDHRCIECDVFIRTSCVYILWYWVNKVLNDVWMLVLSCFCSIYLQSKDLDRNTQHKQRISRASEEKLWCYVCVSFGGTQVKGLTPVFKCLDAFMQEITLLGHVYRNKIWLKYF